MEEKKEDNISEKSILARKNVLKINEIKKYINKL